MPLSEFLRLAMEKLESSKQKPCSTDLSSRTENDLVELVWENGQIMMQGQSNRVTRSPTHHSLPPNTPKARDAALGNSTTARIEKFGGVESIFNGISPVVPSGQLDLSQNDEMVPCLSYPVDDGLQDYCSELLPEISGVTAKGMPAGNSFVSGDKGSSCDQALSNLDNGEDAFKFSSSKARPLCSWPPQRGQTSDPSLLSGVSSIISSDTSNGQDAIFGNYAQVKDMVSDSSSTKMESQNIALPIDNSSLLNFSHFSRPATLVKASLPISGGISSSVPSGIKKMEVKEKGSASRCSNPVKSMLINRLNSMQKDMDFYVPSAPNVVSSRQLLVKEPKESFIAERTENFCQDTFMKTDKALIQSNTANSTGVLEGDRSVEPVVASSSVDSGNSADRVSYEQTHNSKRKFCDIEESELHSDDIQTESVGFKKLTPARGGTGSKRSRAAEVHNLSERRRRDRINEKMRALQELIPNCNKADKASMLDEAIEYLKNLQHQVQIMSMGAGLCIPPMMFHPGTQHMYHAPIPHFSPMGVGMGMSMSFGNINGGSPQCPIFPVPSIQRARFPSSALGLTNLQGIPVPNLPIHGHPSPGLHTRVPRAPLVPSTGRHQISAVDSSALMVSSHNEVPRTSSNLNSEDRMTNKNSQSMHNAEASSSIDHTSNQLQATNEVSNRSAVVQENNRAADALTTTTATEISSD